MGESESDVDRVNVMMRNHNTTSTVHTESDNEEFVIERLRRRQRRACSDWEDDYEFVDLLD